MIWSALRCLWPTIKLLFCMNILLIERNTSAAHWCLSELKGAQVFTFCNLIEASDLLQSGQIQLVVLDRTGTSAQSLNELRQLRLLASSPDVIFSAEASNEELAIAALRGGAWDYLKSPASIEDQLSSMRRWLAFHHSPGITSGQKISRIVGVSATIARLRADIAKVAQSDCNVLITGETGTGKELVAEMIHTQGPRERYPLVCVNCAAVPDLLFESELFGYERGAFTGANATHDGKLRQANGGTLFFDEVGEMSLLGQSKILRAIESRVIQRLGGRTNIPIDARIVAATNQPLEQLCGNNLFRKDLLFRLSVVRLHLPPLRERVEDIPGLLDHFVQSFSNKCHFRLKGFTHEAMSLMRRYSWPGNIRELRNVVEAIFVNRPVRLVGIEDLPVTLTGGSSVTPKNMDQDRDALMEALRLTGWNKSKVADKLKWSRMTVYRKMAQYGIEPVPRMGALAGGKENRKALAARTA